MEKERADSDEIYRYLGFDVHPGRVKEFWGSESEKKEYVKLVKGKSFSLLDRDKAILNINMMSTTDRMVSLAGSLLLIMSFFLPVYSFQLQNRAIAGSGINYFLNLPFIGSYATCGGFVMMLIAILFALILICCPIAGALNLIGVLNRAKGDSYFVNLKKYSRFTFVPIFVYLALFVVLILGVSHPFGWLGSESLCEKLNFAAVFKMTGVGFWTNIVGLVLGFAQSRGI
jgi:hypothetical protein